MRKYFNLILKYIYILIMENTQKDKQKDEFGFIIDPETNKQVPIKSAIGTQIIKNYLECMKNGPESNKIISTKMFYKPKSKTAKTQSSSSNNVAYELAKKLSISQYSLDKIYNKEKQNLKNIKKGSKIWLKRSSGKWQRAIVYEAYKKNNDYFLNAYLNTEGGKVASKKDLPLKSIVIA